MALARVPDLSLLINREDSRKAEIINFNIRVGRDLLGWHFSSFLNTLRVLPGILNNKDKDASG